MDLGYQLRKASFVPLSDFPYYAFRFVRGRLHRFCSQDKRLAFWGPQINGMEELLAGYTLEEVCALQWKRCVDRAMQDFSLISHDRVVEVGYEDFVRSPRAELERILHFLGCKVEPDTVNKTVVDVSAASIGKGMATLGDEIIQRILPHIRETQQRLGYA
jgi:hypothetical protein